MQLNPLAGKYFFSGLFVLLLLFLALPMVQLLVESWHVNGQFSFAHYTEVLSDKKFRTALSNSLMIAAISACTATVLAFLLAYTVHRTRLPSSLKQLIHLGAQLPMLLPTITYGFAIIYTFGKQGLITRLFGFQIFSDIYGFKGMWLGYTLYTVPIAFLLLNNTFHYLDKKCVLVSILMADPAWRRFDMTVLRPLIGTLAAAFIQCFFLSFTDFGIPASIGGQYEVIATRLYTEMLGSSPSFGRGAVVSLTMLLPSIVSIVLLAWLSRFNIRYQHLLPVALPSKPWLDMVLGGVSLSLLLSMFSIFVVILVVPWVRSWPYVLEFSSFTVWNVLTTPNLMTVYRNSVMVALFTAFFGTALAFLAALVHERTSLWRGGKFSIEAGVLITNTIPGMVLGIAYLMLFSGSTIANTLLIIVICNIIHYFSTPYLMSKTALAKMNLSWETTAALMGDSWLLSLWRVVLPNALPTLIEMLAYYFINAMVTISAVIFIAGSRTMVLTSKIKELQHFAKFDEIFVLSVMVLITNLAALFLLSLWKMWQHRRMQ